SEAPDRVAVLPLGLLFTRSVPTGIAAAVARETIRLALQQLGSVSGTSGGYRVTCRAVDGEDVHSIQDLRGYSVGSGAGGNVSDAGDLVVGGRCAVEVVLAYEHHRQALDRGKVEPLVKGAFVRRALSKEANRHLPAALQL